jgi:hypothetical protein
MEPSSPSSSPDDAGAIFDNRRYIIRRERTRPARIMAVRRPTPVSAIETIQSTTAGTDPENLLAVFTQTIDHPVRQSAFTVWYCPMNCEETLYRIDLVDAIAGADPENTTGIHERGSDIVMRQGPAVLRVAGEVSEVTGRCFQKKETTPEGRDKEGSSGAFVDILDCTFDRYSLDCEGKPFPFSSLEMEAIQSSSFISDPDFGCVVRRHEQCPYVAISGTVRIGRLFPKNSPLSTLPVKAQEPFTPRADPENT